jgi:RNA polymerase sigma factor (TIGR02999 family)
MQASQWEVRRGHRQPDIEPIPQKADACRPRIGTPPAPSSGIATIPGTTNRMIPMGDITTLLARARDGDRPAFDALFQRLYPELRRVAHARLAGHQRGTGMQTTVLLHECYLRFLKAGNLTPTDRGHFIAYASHVMRSIIVDTVRASARACRGGDAEHVTLDTASAESLAQPHEELLDIDRALDDLARLEPRLAQVVEMRYFAGLSDAEIAEALGVTDRTVRRDWDKARLLLAHALRG